MQRRRLPFLVPALMAFVMSSCGPPAGGPPGHLQTGGGPPHHGPGLLFHVFDDDDDHQLSPVEIDAAPDKLRELDDDQDGHLMADEITPHREPPPSGGPPHGWEEGPLPGAGPPSERDPPSGRPPRPEHAPPQ